MPDLRDAHGLSEAWIPYDRRCMQGRMRTIVRLSAICHRQHAVSSVLLFEPAARPFLPFTRFCIQHYNLEIWISSSANITSGLFRTDLTSF